MSPCGARSGVEAAQRNTSGTCRPGTAVFVLPVNSCAELLGIPTGTDVDIGERVTVTVVAAVWQTKCSLRAREPQARTVKILQLLRCLTPNQGAACRLPFV